MKKTIQKSGEDYLEAIYTLFQAGKEIHSVDVARLLGVTKPSTSKALQILAEQGYINKESYKTITLTQKGEEYAKAVQKKHNAICTLLVEVLKVSRKSAEIDACKIEHFIGEETTERLYEFYNKFENKE